MDLVVKLDDVIIIPNKNLTLSNIGIYAPHLLNVGCDALPLVFLVLFSFVITIAIKLY